MFDRCDVVSTKSMTQERRTAGKVGATVSFTDDIKIPMKKDIFLANKKNKQAFVIQLVSFWQKQGFETLNADGDADVLIVKTAVESANTEDTILVGDDTDLLILLAHYVRMDAHRLYMRPEPKASSKKRRVWYSNEIKKDLGEDVCRHLFFYPRPTWMRHHIQHIRNRKGRLTEEVCELRALPSASTGIRQPGIDCR